MTSTDSDGEEMISKKIRYTVDKERDETSNTGAENDRKNPSAIYYDDVCIVSTPKLEESNAQLSEVKADYKTSPLDTTVKKRKLDHSDKEAGLQDSNLNEPIAEQFNSPTDKECDNKPQKTNNDDSELSPHILDDLEEEIERELGMKAEKANLTAWNVKNMIKAVITDCEVMKMVDYTLHKSMEKPAYELKLTRAKTKELKGLDQNALWNIPVASPKKSDIEALITQELPEDSSDEEYEPLDELSDEESKASEGILDDDGIDLDTSTKTVSTNDHSISDENIGQRTRSKLCLSETPLEAIEQSFVPPDITTDMYDIHCDNLDWLEFLKEFMQPLDSNHQEAVDDDNDPEYNVMIDEEHEDADTEELREDRAVKVTKKELNDLMSELAEYTEMLSSDDDEANNNVEDCDNNDENIENSTEATETQAYLSGQFSESQCYLLRQQLQQHVQLLLQSYLLSFGHPYADDNYSAECRKRLEELANLRKIWSTSFLDVLNLDSSMKLITDWNAIISDSNNTHRIQRFMLEEYEKVGTYKASKVHYRPKIPEELILCCLKSDAFLYPLYLPSGGFTTFTMSGPFRFNRYEDQLISMGLEQFSALLGSNVEVRQDLMEVVSYIQHLLIPVKTEDQIMVHIKKIVKENISNPIKEFFMTGKAPEVKHYVVVHNHLNALKNNPDEYFPESWLKYL